MIDSKLHAEFQVELFAKLFWLKFSIFIDIKCIKDSLQEIFLSIGKEPTNHISEDFDLEQVLRLEVATIHEYLLYLFLW